MSEQIIKSEYTDVMQKSYIDYSMSVITSRALPDIRDGLKPVQRRVLFAMHGLGLTSKKPHRKSARIVGDAMGKYHPHGDSSIYETLVVLSQDFKKGMALIDGHGNFGSIEGDGAAAMRYTEAKLKEFTEEVFLSDLEKDVVDFKENFDGSEKEPVVLPVKLPNILINGAEGIAVGMVTNIPPHNIEEVIDASKFYFKSILKEKVPTTKEVMKYIKGPDFPTGGIVVNKDELLEIYETGVGKIRVRGKIDYVEGVKSKKDKLIISEIPYTMVGAGISKFMMDVVNLVEKRELTDVVDISNESSKEGIRIVLDLKKGADISYIKNVLYRKTKLEDTFSVNMLAIVNERPETLGICDVIKHYCNFYYEINTRKYEKLLEISTSNKEIKEGLIKAVDCIDVIIEMLRGSKNLENAKKCLMNGETSSIKFKSEASKKQAKKFNFTKNQAEAILSMKLYRLIGLEIEQLNEEYKKVLEEIKRYQELLGNKDKMTETIIKELDSLKKKYSLKRKTEIDNIATEIIVKKEEKLEDSYVLIDRFSYIKKIEESIFEKNSENIEDEYKYIKKLKESIYLFTNLGNLHKIQAKNLSFSKLKDKGIPIDNISNYKSSTEDIINILNLEEKNTKILFATKFGYIKIVDSSELISSKRSILATKLEENDEIVSAINLEEVDEKLIVKIKTTKGYKLAFSIKEVPLQKKSAKGVMSIKLAEDDSVKEVVVLEQTREKLQKRNTKGKK